MWLSPRSDSMGCTAWCAGPCFPSLLAAVAACSDHDGYHGGCWRQQEGPQKRPRQRNAPCADQTQGWIRNLPTLAAIRACTRAAKASVASPGRCCWGGRKVTVATTAQLDRRRSRYLARWRKAQWLGVCAGCAVGRRAHPQNRGKRAVSAGVIHALRCCYGHHHLAAAHECSQRPLLAPHSSVTTTGQCPARCNPQLAYLCAPADQDSTAPTTHSPKPPSFLLAPLSPSRLTR
jgi:hypothetical protein